MLRLHTTFLLHFCAAPIPFIRVCKRTAHFLRRVFTLTHFPSGKAGISAFRHIRRDAENVSKSVNLQTNFLRVLAENARLKCASVNDALVNGSSIM